MKKLAVIACVTLLLLLSPAAFPQQLSDYWGYTASQLSAMTDYVTIPNTSYWNSHAYAQIKLLLDWAISRDAFVTTYGTPDSVYYQLGAGADTISGTTIRGMIHITDPKYIFIPPSVTLAANRDHIHTGGVRSLIDVSAAHDVVITGGGTLYGKADSSWYNNGQTEHDAGIEIKSSRRVLVDGLNIKYPVGDGINVGYIQWPTYNDVDTSYYKVESNGVVIRNVEVYCPTMRHWLHPVNEQIGRNAIAVTGARNVVIDGCRLYGGVPAVIDVEGNTSVIDTVDNLIITNCIIDGLSKGHFTIGAVVNDSSFYLKNPSGCALNIAVDSLVGVRLLSDEFGVVASVSGGSVNDWQVIVSNTATALGNTTITVEDDWETTPTGYYTMIYEHSSDWPVLPDSTMFFGEGFATGAGSKTVTVTGITATLNQLAGHRLYLTSYPMARGGIRLIATNAVSEDDSVLVTLNRSFLGTTPLRGMDVGLGDSFGTGIGVGGNPLYRNIIIANNIVRNTYDYGIRLQQGGTDTTHKIIVANNRFENCYGAVALEVAGTRNIKLIGNHIYNCRLGINVMGPENQSVESNTVVNCPTGGIWVLGSAGGDSTGTISNTTVTGNIVIDCGNTGAAYPEESIWLAWTKNSTCSGNSIINSDTSTSVVQRAMLFSYCKDLFLGENNVVGYNGRYWWQEGCTFQNTVFNYNKTNFSINKTTSSFPFAVADSVNGTSYTAISGGIVYPNAVSAKNKIYVNGSTLVLEGGLVSVLSVLDTSAAAYIPYPLAVTRNDSDQTYVQLNAMLNLGSYTSVEKATLDDLTAGALIYDSNTGYLETYTGGAWRNVSTGFKGIRANNYTATAGDMWVNTSHDTLWYKYDATNSLYWVITGTSTAH